MSNTQSPATAEDMLGQWHAIIRGRIALSETVMAPAYYQVGGENVQLQLLAIIDENRELKRLDDALAKVAKSLARPLKPKHIHRAG